MPLDETEWDLVTDWVQTYLVDTTEPHIQLAQLGFPRNSSPRCRWGRSAPTTPAPSCTSRVRTSSGSSGSSRC
ncbi:hypothetical protein [Streptomyces sirii]|uniref:hypothetical protein n=1 Tax=Streptomyces sirii TaxID=3127701 RepID=UPI003D363C6A